MSTNYNNEVSIETTNNRIITKESILSWIRYLALLLCIVLFIRFGIGISIISGNSMNPTLEDGSVVIVNKIAFSPERNDIVVVKDSHGYNIIKRVIALPGENIEIVNGNVLINNEEIQEDYILGTSFDIPSTEVPEGHFFIIGDNRTPGESLDSRDASIGPINQEFIVGESMLSLFPFKGL
ncbi:signal peptidase I [Bacillus suaedaesalsae]|uniref:Signal peptidase I n=1 Tax=Bacillus suaedaesalsae TaxID=2810349 RepID=A0ABS2DKX2_9BACI|nr:signal peptidase I [Bacillus suaedaesalsae]MBM6619135.1 signal peptidase I [Bacillus suaedaesalsae]